MKAPENNNKKGGFLAGLSKIFGGSAASGGAASGLGSAASGGFSGMLSGIGGLFATKAGIVGMVLGGATIAAGVGVIYNFVGPSSKPIYSPSLFENQYYESEVESASVKRMANADSDAASSSSLDYFRDEAKRDGMGFGENGEGAEGEVGAADGEGADNLGSASADGAVEGYGGNYGDNAPMANVGKLQKAPSFGSSGGSSQSKLTMGGSGMSGGIGSKFQKIYKAPIGRASSMKGALASKINKASKYSLATGNRKGAYGQAKYSGKLGKQAAYADSGAGAKTTATESFDGKTTGEGDVDAPDMGGAGLGGGGVSDGDGLKGSDPSLNSNNSTPPPEPEAPEEDNPWQKEEDMALYGMIISAVLIVVTRLLAKFAKAVPWMYTAAVACAYAAMAAAAVVIYAGMMMMSKYGQKWMGMMYMAVGAVLIFQAYQALTAVGEAAGANPPDGLGKGVKFPLSGGIF